MAKAIILAKDHVICNYESDDKGVVPFVVERYAGLVIRLRNETAVELMLAGLGRFISPSQSKRRVRLEEREQWGYRVPLLLRYHSAPSKRVRTPSNGA